MSDVGSVRERRRAETVKEIKAAALAQLTEGAGDMSLRAVARAVGMTVQSLYHYFDSREALLTALVVDGHDRLAAAVQEAVDASRGLPHDERMFAASNAYRTWALANRQMFLLLYGSPVPGFAAPSVGAAGDAAFRLAGPFMEVVFDGWTPEQLDAVPLQPGAERLTEADLGPMPLPIGALAFFYELRARMHGLVMLELFGHLAPLDSYAEELFRNSITRSAAEVTALRNSVEPADEARLRSV